MKDQDRKYFRAHNVVEKLSQELKEIVPNPEAFEHDMDLREEKEVNCFMYYNNVLQFMYYNTIRSSCSNLL